MPNESTNIAKTAELEIVPSSAIESITRGEIDVQIATAHRYPRSMATFKQRAIEMATLDEDTAASCIYSRPVGGGKFAEGLSVRTAEIVGACYGNLRVGAMIVEQSERQVKARGFAHDLESNFASSCEVIEATVKRDGTPYDERMRVVIAKACLAKARRDATFQVVPKALCKPIENAARAVAIGDASTITKRRTQVMDWISKLGIDQARVFGALKVKGVDDIGLEELAILTGLRTAIKDGDVTVDEAFPLIAATGNVGAKKSAVDDASKGEAKTPPSEEKKPVDEAFPPKEGEKAPEPAKSAGPTIEEMRTAIKSKLGKLGTVTAQEFVSALVKRGMLKDAVVFNEVPLKTLIDADDDWENIEAELKAKK